MWHSPVGMMPQVPIAAVTCSIPLQDAKAEAFCDISKNHLRILMSMTVSAQAYPRHSLSRAALITSGVPIFLLNAFTEVIVYYAAGAPPGLLFPPPQTSLLRRSVNAVRAARRLTPQLRMLREGVDDVAPFMRHLIEEPEMGADGKVAFSGMVQFLYDVQTEVWEYLQEQGYGQ